MRPVRAAPAPEQFALAVDLGTSGLKVGLVSLAGTIAWHEHTPLTTRVDGDAATQDATRWWALVRDSARRALGLGDRSAGPGGGGQRHRAVGQHGAGGRRRRPRRTLCAVDGHPGRTPLPGGHRRPGRRLRPAGRPHLDQAIRRRPVPLGGRPHRAHALPAGRRAGEPGRGPVVPRAGRLPVHVLHRHPGGIPCLHGRRLAHRQPAPRRAGLRPGAGGPFGRRPGAVAPAPPHGHGDRNGPPSGGDRSRPSGRRAGGHRHAGPPLSRVRVRCGARVPGPSGREHQRVDRCTGPVQEDRCATAGGQRPGAGCRWVPDRRQPRGRWCLPRLAVRRDAGPGRPAGPPRLRRGHPAGGGRGARLVRRGLHAVATRRAVAGRGPARPGRVPQPLAHHRPPRAGPGGPRGRGVQQPVAPRRGGAVRQAPARPVAHGRRRGAVGPVVPDPCRRDGPDHRAGGRAAGGQPARCGHLRRPGPRSRAARRGSGDWSGWTRCSVPIPPTEPPTTACTPSIPSCTPRSAGCSPASTDGGRPTGRAERRRRRGARGTEHGAWGGRRPGYHGRRLARSPAQWGRGGRHRRGDGWCRVDGGCCWPR